jgi:hypothetical protein
VRNKDVKKVITARLEYGQSKEGRVTSRALKVQHDASFAAIAGKEHAAIPGERPGTMRRMMSPSGGSTLITSAPKPPRICVDLRPHKRTQRS